jgi:isobutyryl-CoA dehydrogenase
LGLRTQALDFAKKKLSPYAIEWEKNEYFPVEAFREAAEMGFAAIYCKSGTGLSRLEASVIFEALATGCVPTAAYLTIHNMCTWVID